MVLGSFGCLGIFARGTLTRGLSYPTETESDVHPRSSIQQSSLEDKNDHMVVCFQSEPELFPEPFHNTKGLPFIMGISVWFSISYREYLMSRFNFLTDCQYLTSRGLTDLSRLRGSPW